MTSKQLHCITVNARGLREKKKRMTMFQWLKQQKCDVALVQETHFTSEMTDFVDMDWAGKAFHSLGSSQSRGVSIFIKPKINIDVVDVHEYTKR